MSDANIDARLLEVLTIKLFERRDKHFYNKCIILAKENNTINKISMLNPAFMYNCMIFPRILSSNEWNSLNYVKVTIPDLHISLKSKFKNMLKIRDPFEEAMANNYFTRILSLSNNTKDLQMLLPDVLFNKISTILSTLFLKEPQKVTTEISNQFNKDYKDEINFIRNLLVTDFLYGD